MNSKDHKEEELRRKEQELRDRELALRLRELEAELNPTEPPLQKTVKHQESESKLKRWYRQFVTVATFLGIVILVIIAVKVATWLATALVIGGIAFALYKIFIERDRSKPH